MLGFVIGTLSLIGLAKLAAHRHRGHCYAYYGHGGCGGGGCERGGWDEDYGDRWGRRGGRGGWRGGYGRRGGRPGGPGFGRRMALRYLFERLDTTPGQEKVIQEAVGEFEETARKHREEWRKSLGELGEAVRGSEFGHSGVAEMWIRHDKAVEEIRLALVAQLNRIHEALDEKQRKILAELIAEGPGWRGAWRRGEDRPEDAGYEST
jgi:hypothetical protein